MRRWFWMAFLMICALVLQATLFNYFPVAGVKPDLLLIIVVLYGLLYGKSAGILGLLYGLAEDLITGRFIGFNAFTKGLMGYFIGLLEPKLFKDHILVPIVVLLIGTLFYGIISFAVGLLVGYFVPFDLEAFARLMILQSIYNACLAPFLYGRYYRLSVQRFVSKLRR
ncbi:MAG: rod shape-determining protein MreD [Bacillota bacterium]